MTMMTRKQRPNSITRSRPTLQFYLHSFIPMSGKPKGGNRIFLVNCKSHMETYSKHFGSFERWDLLANITVIINVYSNEKYLTQLKELMHELSPMVIWKCGKYFWFVQNSLILPTNIEHQTMRKPLLLAIIVAALNFKQFQVQEVTVRL